MDKAQAKEILLSYRPGRDDTLDPQIAEALRLLDQDPELARWFVEQQRADEVIRARLRAAPVPADLKQRILAEQKIVRPDFAWRRPVLIAAAAVVMHIPANSSFDLEAGTFSGVIDSDFEIQVEGKISPKEVHGTVNKGGARIRAKSFSGNVEIRKH